MPADQVQAGGVPEQRVAGRLRALPDRPGIYIFRDGSGRPLYVGKAKSLRKRGASYLRPGPDDRILAMLHEAWELECVLTDTEAEALLLENNWIKRHRPRYNILLRDDKTYPYLKLTADPFPRLAFTRRVRDDGGTYFGPYLPGGLARKAIKLVQKLFQIRVCTIDIDGSLPRPCLYHDMSRCLGPCVDGLTTDSLYREAVERAALFLSGRNELLLRDLRRQMEEAAELLEFELAARLRDAINEIEAVGQRQKLSSVSGEDVDVYGLHQAGGDAAVVILVMRGGQLLDRRELFWEGQGEVAPERLLAELLPQVYDRQPFVPREIHLPVPIEEAEALEEWLSERKGQRAYVRVPARGPKEHRVSLARRNAQLAHRRRFRGPSPQRVAQESLARHLELAELPNRIEGFDVAHLQGALAVASMVVWEDGRMRRREYRSFNIRGITPGDDLAALRQAVLRRYRRVLEEVGVMPDLVMIDGGRGQLNAALAALAELGVEETPIVALAKAEEELYRPSGPRALRLLRRDAGLRLLQEVRDEAHRFAGLRHRAQRRTALLGSRLEELRGIGPKRRRALLRRFGSLAGVRAAAVGELAEVVGSALAGSVAEQLAQDAESKAPESGRGGEPSPTGAM